MRAKLSRRNPVNSRLLKNRGPLDGKHHVLINFWGRSNEDQSTCTRDRRWNLCARVAKLHGKENRR